MCIPQEDYPPTLRSYLASARNLSLERTCSNEPLLSYPPSSSPRVPHSLPRVDPTWHKLPLSGRGKRSNAEREGLSQKKGHEVTRFSDLLKSHALGSPTHVIDVGAGCVRPSSRCFGLICFELTFDLVLALSLNCSGSSFKSTRFSPSQSTCSSS